MLRFGIIGYGFMGKTHAQNIRRHPDAEITAIYTIPPAPSQEPNVTLYTEDWHQLIDDDRVDAVVIATPTPSHVEIAEYAASKGKHLFIEKPMGRTVAECTRIINAAKKTGVYLFIAHVLRFWPSYAAACHATRSSESSIGELKMIRARRLSGFPGWSQWFADEKLSGGCILDLSIHDIDYTVQLMNKKVKEVYCEARRLPELGIDNWGLSMTTLTFEDGTLGYCEASWAGAKTFPFTVDCEIIGTQGIIRFDSRTPNPVNFYGESARSDNPIDMDGYYNELNAFIQGIQHNTTPIVSGEIGRYAVAICEAAIESARTHKPIELSKMFPEVDNI
jgi:predicted dehydrogenase